MSGPDLVTIDRRAFLGGLGLSMLAAPIGSEAPPSGTARRIALFSTLPISSLTEPWWEAFVASLREQDGWSTRTSSSSADTRGKIQLRAEAIRERLPPSDARGCEGLACPAVAPVPRPGAAPYSSCYCFSNTPTLFTAWPWAFAPFVVTVIVFPS